MYDATVGVSWEIFRVFSTTCRIVCSTIYRQLFVAASDRIGLYEFNLFKIAAVLTRHFVKLFHSFTASF